MPAPPKLQIPEEAPSGAPPLPTTESQGIGLCLSGGGIRSAAFSSGVLSSLLDRHPQQRVTAVSCVSGGGFVGAAFVAWAKVMAAAGVPLHAWKDVFFDHMKRNSDYLCRCSSILHGICDGLIVSGFAVLYFSMLVLIYLPLGFIGAHVIGFVFLPILVSSDTVLGMSFDSWLVALLVGAVIISLSWRVSIRCIGASRVSDTLKVLDALVASLLALFMFTRMGMVLLTETDRTGQFLGFETVAGLIVFTLFIQSNKKYYLGLLILVGLYARVLMWKVEGEVYVFHDYLLSTVSCLWTLLAITHIPHCCFVEHHPGAVCSRYKSCGSHSASSSEQFPSAIHPRAEHG